MAEGERYLDDCLDKESESKMKESLGGLYYNTYEKVNRPLLLAKDQLRRNNQK